MGGVERVSEFCASFLCRSRPRWFRKRWFPRSPRQNLSSLQTLPPSRLLTWTWWSWPPSSWLATAGNSWPSWCRRNRGTISSTSCVRSTASSITSPNWWNSTPRWRSCSLDATGRVYKGCFSTKKSTGEIELVSWEILHIKRMCFYRSWSHQRASL